MEDDSHQRRTRAQGNQEKISLRWCNAKEKEGHTVKLSIKKSLYLQAESS